MWLFQSRIYIVNLLYSGAFTYFGTVEWSIKLSSITSMISAAFLS